MQYPILFLYSSTSNCRLTYCKRNYHHSNSHSTIVQVTIYKSLLSVWVMRALKNSAIHVAKLLLSIQFNSLTSISVTKCNILKSFNLKK